MAHHVDILGCLGMYLLGYDYAIIALLVVVVYLTWRAKKAEEHTA